MTEQRYKAVQGVLADGRTVSEVAGQWNISRRTMHRWLARYEGEGMEALGDRSHRPAHCPHQMPAGIEVMVLEMRRAHAYWGARRIAFELRRKGVEPAPSESAVYRCLVRAAVIDPATRRRRRESWKRWERGGPMELPDGSAMRRYLVALSKGPKVDLEPHRRAPDQADLDGVRRWVRNARRPTAIDLFSGAGGLSLGLHDSGFSILVAADSDMNAIRTHRHNLDGLGYHGDLSDPTDFLDHLDAWGVRQVDLIAGGVPCQPFSVAGKSKIRSLVEPILA